MKVGAYVTLEKWNATEPLHKHLLGHWRIFRLRPAICQSGILADIEHPLSGQIRTGLDIAWLTEIKK